ncbi:hypothetical protein CP533_6738 [Ophiocordyceps camponoti-saundersi (nom. inval.)]|nr:hypothetical protein CP533_6738 [Ophiocordyceps camponoti-saundersi (nom. inval.)]
MTGALLISRYSAEDLETASMHSMHSTAPSYVSDAPSYHSNPPYPDSAPAYAPLASPTSPALPRPMLDAALPSSDATRPRSVGLPPIPPAMPPSAVSVHNFRLPTWSANNAPAARHYKNVAERRISDGRYNVTETIRRPALGGSSALPLDNGGASTMQPRPLEDPYLVGEVAAAQARRERLAREEGDDILIREDRQWDWLLAHMKVCEERQRNLTRFRQNVDTNQRKTLLHRIGGRLLPSTLI